MAQLKEGSIIKKATGDEVIATLNDVPDSNDIPTALSQLNQDENNRLVTDVEKNKLAGIEAGAQKNIMTSADKTKLNGVETGAQKNTITSVQGRTGAVTVSKSDVGLGNLDNIKQMPISDGVLENYREKLTTVSASGGSINLSLGNVFQHTPSGNRTYSISNAVNGQAHSFTLIINMGSTVRTLTFPASVKWQGGEIPDLSTASKTYVLTFVSINGGTTWFGMFGGEF